MDVERRGAKEGAHIIFQNGLPNAMGLERVEEKIDALI